MVVPSGRANVAWPSFSAGNGQAKSGHGSCNRDTNVPSAVPSRAPCVEKFQVAGYDVLVKYETENKIADGTPETFQGVQGETDA